MAQIQTAAGTQVEIGSFANGYPTMLTTGDRLTVADPGTPLVDYSEKPTSPLKLWKTQPSLRKVVGFVAREVAQIPWHAYQRLDDRDRRRVSSSAAEQLMQSPAPLVDGYQLITSLVTDLALYDVCLAILIEGDLVRVPPGRIRVVSDWMGRPAQVWVETPDDADDVDVTHVAKVITWGWHASKSGGVSPMHTLAAILHEQIESVEWRTRQWADRPKVAGLLKRPAEATRWSSESRERFKADWERFKSGGSGTPILEQGMEYQELASISPKDAQDVVGRQLTDAEVASAFYVPPELVGARPGNFSNIDAFRQMLFGPTLGPLIVQLQQAVNNGGIIPAVDTTEGLYLEPNRESVLAGSMLEQIRYMQSAVGGPVMTRAEARARLNLPFIDGTDELITPLNVTEGGQASPTDSGEQNEGGLFGPAISDGMEEAQ